jgi:hypothetical protein
MSSDSEAKKEIKESPEDKLQEGVKTEAKRAAEPIFKQEAPSSTELGISSSGQSGVLPSQQMLLDLAHKDFDLNEVWKVQEIYALLGEHGWQRVMERAEAKFDKWRRKQGFKYPEISQERARRGFLIYTLLDYCVSSANDLFLITGANRAWYRSFAERVMKGLTQNAPSGWLRVAHERLSEWSVREGANKDILKVLTWVALKAYAFYWKQMGF